MVTEQIAPPIPHKNIAHSSSDSLSEQCSSQQTASLYRINDAITNGPLMVSSSTTQAKRKQKSASEGREKHTTNESVRGKMRLLTNDIRLEYEFFRLLAKEEDIEDGVLELVDKKLFESTPARPFFVWSIYHYLKSLTGITNHKFDIYFSTCIPLIFELVICITYWTTKRM